MSTMLDQAGVPQKIVSSKSKSPLRKAISLSTLFRPSLDARSTSPQLEHQTPPQQSSHPPFPSFPPSSSTSTTASPMPTLRRYKRRLSLGLRSPSLSPSLGMNVSPSLSSPSTAAPSTPGAPSRSNPAGRPRSGSCRAALRYGYSNAPVPGRVLPFTLPALGDDEETKVRRSDEPVSRDSSSLPPRRPRTPAPLLDLDTGMNSLGIQTNDVTQRSTSFTTGLGLSTVARPSLSSDGSIDKSTSGQRRRMSVGAPLQRLPRQKSHESFQCRGLTATEIHHFKYQDESTPAMSRSVSESTQSNAFDSHKLPGASLSMRRRPWALSLQLQLQPPATVRSAVPPRRSSIADRHRARHGSPLADPTRCGPSETLIENDAPLTSRFSSATDLTSDANHTDDDLLLPEGDAINLTPALDQRLSPESAASTWASSAISHDYTRYSLRDASELPPICPPSPARHVRLHLTLPPTSVAKHAGLPSEKMIYASTAISVLELKEEICNLLLQSYGLSISPSQLGLFSIDIVSAPSSPYTPVVQASLLSSSPTALGSPKTCSRSVSRGAVFSSRSPDHDQDIQAGHPLTSSPPSRTKRSFATFSRHSRQSSGSRPQHTTASTAPNESFRRLQNDAALYQEGLQDDDEIIVRF